MNKQSIIAAQALEIAHLKATTISLQEIWEVGGGNPSIKATKEDVLMIMRLFVEMEEELDQLLSAKRLS